MTDPSKTSPIQNVEFVTARNGTSILRWTDRIVSTDTNIADVLALAQALSSGPGATFVMGHRLGDSVRDHFSPAPNRAQEPRKSIIGSILGGRTSVSVLWRGPKARDLAHTLAKSRAATPLLEFPPPPADLLGRMKDLYHRLGGFPTVPLWARHSVREPNAAIDLERAILGQRLVVVAAEGIAFWELDYLLSIIKGEGVAVLPVTFSNDRVLIGPLIIGGNATSFYLSRFGPLIVNSPEMTDAAKLLCMSERFEGQQTALVTQEILEIAEAMPDESCVSVREVRDSAYSVKNEIDLSWRILDSPLEGSLWSLRRLLNPDVVSHQPAWGRAAAHLQSGGVLSIDSAFRAEVADAMHLSLSVSDKWRLHEEIHPFFFYHHHNIYDAADLSPTMLIVSLMFASRHTTDWAASLVGSDCSGAVQQSASWYMPGDHSTPHSDAAARRKLAFVWHLAANWDDSWGGHLVCLRSETIIPAAFNSLHLFDTRKSGSHCVMQVAPNAGGKRLAWNGWWTSRELDSAPPEDDLTKEVSRSEGQFRFR